MDNRQNGLWNNKDKNIQAVGGLTLGADPIAIATSLYANTQNKTIYPFIVRKEPKSHGTRKLIESSLNQALMYLL